jgi:dTDP-4-dehydrorhamnose 3,5-epimerase
MSQVRALPGVGLVDYSEFKDSRGTFKRVMDEKQLETTLTPRSICQVSFSKNYQLGTFRGLHGLILEAEEFKYVQCVRGEILDFVVDYRLNSPNYLDYSTFHLSAEQSQTLVVPPGCLHGYLTLCDDTELIYLTTVAYNSALEIGVRYDDPKINLILPFEPTNISTKDLTWKSLY